MPADPHTKLAPSALGIVPPAPRSKSYSAVPGNANSREKLTHFQLKINPRNPNRQIIHKIRTQYLWNDFNFDHFAGKNYAQRSVKTQFYSIWFHRAWPWNSWRYDRKLFLERKDYYNKLKEIFLPHRTINLSNIHATYSPKGPFNICEFIPAIFCAARNKEWFERVTWHMTRSA